MKTSNKILIGILLVSFGFAITSHVVLRGKFLRGDFISKNKMANFFYDVHALTQPKFIKLYKLDACCIKQGAKPLLSIEKGLIRNVNYIVKNDTLVIYGDSAANQWASPRVKLELPVVSFVDIRDCKVIIEGSRDSSSGTNFRLSMNNGHLYTRQPYGDTVIKKYFGVIEATATNNSEIVLYRKDSFNNINLDLSNSTFYERNAKYNDINIRSDSNSTIVTGGKTFSYAVSK